MSAPNLKAPGPLGGGTGRRTAEKQRAQIVTEVTAGDERKREANCAARAALIGLELHQIPGGGFVFVYGVFGAREGLLCAVPDLAAAEAALDQFEADWREVVAAASLAGGASHGH